MTTTADLAALTKELERLRNDLSKVAKATESLVRNARDDAMEMGGEVWESAKEKVERRVEEHPLQSAAIALGVGVVLGMLFSRR